MILSGDIGGTHARLSLYKVSGDRLELARHEIFLSRNYSNLRQVIHEFMKDSGTPVEAACFGVAGPVLADRVVASNLPWVVRRDDLQKTLKTGSVWLMNDLQAAEYGIDELIDEDLYEVRAGQREQGNRVLLFAGTGLGEALSVWVGDRLISSPSEGGHSDFSPTTEAEMELRGFLGEQFGHVSWERVLSGPGILNLYQFFQNRDPCNESAEFLEKMKSVDPSIAIMSEAEIGANPNCVKAREWFIRFLGREAGNLALKGFAKGGVYLGGGIAPTIRHLLKTSLFLEGFLAKGRMRALLSNIPVRVILNDSVGLRGAARFAVSAVDEELRRKIA